MTMSMTKKHLLTMAGVVLAIGAGVLAYNSLTMQKSLDVPTEGPVIVGGLVGIGPSTITVKATDGTEMTFAGSYKTRVISQVKEGEVGKVYEQLSVGDVLAVTADFDGTRAKKIEILPIGRSPSSSQPPVALTGTVVSVASTSLVVRPVAPNPAMAATIADVLVQVGRDTDVLTEVLGTQTGKALREIRPGAKVSVWGTRSEQGMAADSILFALTQ